MPYKSESIRLVGLQDRRRKLTDDQKDEIRQMYSSGGWSLNKLAKHFDVSKATILILVNPNSAERVKKYRKEHWREFQRTKEERAATVREHRRYKQSLYISGQIKQNDLTDDAK